MSDDEKTGDVATNEGMPPAVEPIAELEKKVSPKPATLGRIVHFVLPVESPNAGQDRPAIVAKVWSDSCANLTVCKGENDDFDGIDGHLDSSPVGRVTSVCYSEGKEPGTWHWPEIV